MEIVTTNRIAQYTNPEINSQAKRRCTTARRLIAQLEHMCSLDDPAMLAQTERTMHYLNATVGVLLHKWRK